MSENGEDGSKIERLADVDRRKFLAGVGAGMSALAGCGGGGEPETVVKTKTVVREQTRTVIREQTDSPTPTPREGGGNTSSLRFNAMGYTGAADLIEQQATLMDPAERQPIVKQILAQMWYDAPTNVLFYSNKLQPTNRDWEGWIQTVGGVIHTDSFLNLRKAGGGTGGRPIQAMDTAPDSLNVLATSTAYSFELLDRIYTYGTTLNPETLEFEPWGFRDWTLTPENVGTSSPTIVGQLRDDLTFNDGEPVTAEDVKFTVEYIQEQEPAGSIAASQFASVESVEVDSPDGTTVNYFLSEKDNAWLTNILGNVILPMHVWSGVSDYQKYTPRNSSEGLVGSGPMQMTDFNWENWFELEMRDDVWENTAEYATWLDSEGPFIDGLRYEIFGSQTALQQAVLDGEVTIGYTGGGFGVDKAVEAQQNDQLRVWTSDDDGWNHMSFNTRRVPMDDRAFRQFLVMMLDSDWVINDLKKGIGGVEGTYITPLAYGEWRPPEPRDLAGADGVETASSYEDIDLPALEFPGDSGTFNIGSNGVQQARQFLTDHGEAKHDYSWQEASVEGAASSDGMVLHVNGEPLNTAHTNNFGEPGQGPLEISFNPPQEDVDEARIMQRWTGAIKTVGVPAASQIQSFNSQIPKVYGNENFDVFAMGWVGIGVNNDHYSQLFGPDGADLGYSSQG